MLPVRPWCPVENGTKPTLRYFVTVKFYITPVAIADHHDNSYYICDRHS
ncbi:MAG: hypothetical protein HWQ43_10925 [Nostoc sp. JL31]|nr:hypothetical protein [Nostoc sp. JL31]MBN3889653.1 hypothetical protein [Nostoc sp. JL31]